MLYFYKRSFLFFYLILVFSGCGNSVQNTPATTKAIIYGKVYSNSITSREGKIAIMLTHYPNGCGSKANEKEIKGFAKDGIYRILFHVGTPSSSSCITATLVSFKDEVSQTADFKILSGPRKINVKLRPNSPYDSVRVDFTYPDSLK